MLCYVAFGQNTISALELAALEDTSGLYSEKRQFLSKALNLCFEQDSVEKIASVYRNLGDLEADFNHKDDALVYYKESIRYADSLNSQIDLGTTYLNMGILFIQYNEVTEAKEILTKSIKAYNNSDKPEYNNLSYLHRAYAYYHLNILDSARFDAQKTLELLDSTHTDEELMLTQLMVLIESAESKPSQESFERLYELYNHYQDLGNSYTLTAITANLGTLYSAVEEYDSALFYYQQSIDFARSNNDVYQIRSIDEKIQVINEILNRENRIRQLRFLAASISSIVLLVILVFIGVVYRNRRKIEKQLLEIRDARIKDLLKEQEIKSTQALLAGQDAERKRIAEELHDRLGSMLATVKLHFNQVNDKLVELGEENQSNFINAEQLLDEASSEVRRISHDLHSGLLQKFGLFAALRQMTESIAEASGIEVNVLRSHWDERLDFDTETNLYRIVQELISNALKHAKATKITIQLSKDIETGTLMYEDNGKGFDLKRVNLGLGLKNIESRVSRINGKLNIDSTPGHGTTVIVEFDL